MGETRKPDAIKAEKQPTKEQSASSALRATVTVTGLIAPSNLSAAPLGKRIILSWRGSGSGVTYNIYRGTSLGGESATPYATGVTTTNAIDRGVVSGTTYYYKVTAVGPGGESAPSNEAHAVAK